MQNHNLQKLEYDTILHILASHAKTTFGKEMCQKLKPSNQIKEVALLQQETSEATSLLIRKKEIPLSEIEPTIGTMLKQIESKQTLSMQSLLHLTKVLAISRQCKLYFSQDEEQLDTASSYPTLSPLFADLYQNVSIEKEMHRCLLDENTIDDNASRRSSPYSPKHS